MRSISLLLIFLFFIIRSIRKQIAKPEHTNKTAVCLAFQLILLAHAYQPTYLIIAKPTDISQALLFANKITSLSDTNKKPFFFPLQLDLICATKGTMDWVHKLK
jgi:hypothetical protein